MKTKKKTAEKINEMHRADYVFLSLVIIISVIIRLLPAFEYPYLTTDDSVYEHQQVQYIMENHQINPESYNGYSKFPMLHVSIVLLSYVSGIDILTVHKFMPIIISSISVLFFFLFARELTKNYRVAIISAAVFGGFFANVWWEMQVVRESFALMLFPIILYLLQKYHNDKRSRFLVLFCIFLATLIPTHHWSSLMMLLTLVVFWVYYNFEVKLLFIIIMFLLLNFLYWYTQFPYLLYLIFSVPFLMVSMGIPDAVKQFYKPFGETVTSAITGGNVTPTPKPSINWELIDFIPLCLSLIICIFFALLMRFGEKISPKFLKSVNRLNLSRRTVAGLGILYTLGFLVLCWYSFRWTRFGYPPQSFINPFIIGFFSVLGGISLLKNREAKFVGMLGFWASVFLVIITLNKFTGNFDVNRVLEFISFPLAIFSGYYFAQCKNFVVTISLSLIFISSLFIYPEVFIFGKPLPVNSVFSDIRSYMRYIPKEGIYAMEWAKANNLSLDSENRYFRLVYETFYLKDGKKDYVHISTYDIIVEKNLEKRYLKISGSRFAPSRIISNNSYKLVYSNEWSMIYHAEAT